MPDYAFCWEGGPRRTRGAAPAQALGFRPAPGARAQAARMTAPQRQEPPQAPLLSHCHTRQVCLPSDVSTLEAWQVTQPAQPQQGVKATNLSLFSAGRDFEALNPQLRPPVDEVCLVECDLCSYNPTWTQTRWGRVAASDP